MSKYLLLCTECKQLRFVACQTFYKSEKIKGRNYRLSLCKTHGLIKRNKTLKGKRKPTESIDQISKRIYIASMVKLDKKLADGTLLDGMGIYTKVNVFEKYNIH